MTIKEMLEKRAELIAKARALFDAAEKDSREPNAEERAKFDTIMEDADELKAQADTRARLESAESDTSTRQTTMDRADRADPPKDAKKPEKRSIELRPSVCGDTRSVEVTVDPVREAAFRRLLLEGPSRITGDETRALQKDSDVAGGYLSASEQFNAELIQAVDNMTFMRQICRVLPPLATADSLGTPSLDNDPADPTWVAELAIGSEDSTMDFGKRALQPKPLAQFIKVSRTLLRRSTIGAESIVRDRLAYKTGVVQENAFLNGSGAGQPLGVFTASADGVTTARDVSTGNIATDVRGDGLLEAFYSLLPQYRTGSLAWIFHRAGVKRIRKLKDGEGRYIWQAGILAAEPDTILGHPVYESEYAPNTWSTGKYVGILGDFSRYWIVDALTLQIQVLIELYASTNQNGYIARSETDGAPVLAEAFARVKLG